MRVPGTPLRFAGLALVLVLALPTQLEAQRDEQIRQAQQAYDNFETGRALNLLQAALVPEEGPRDSLWAHGVHLLAQIHLEEGRDRVARSWLRWARRLVNDMPLDRVVFLPEVLAASSDARSFVVAATEPPADAVQTAWRWSTGSQDPVGQGRLEIQSASPDVTLTVSVGNRPSVRPGDVLTLPTESHEIRASAQGVPAVRFVREVLPGVTTVVTIGLAPIAVAAEPPPVQPPVVAEPEEERPAAPPPTPTPQQPTVRRGGGKFPIAIVLGGLAAAGGAAFLLLGGGGENGPTTKTCPDGSVIPVDQTCPTATTGGITISVPNQSIFGHRRR